MYKTEKRFLNCVYSHVELIILSPMFLILIVVVKLDTEGPILLKQRRVEINRNRFDMYKFCAMRIETTKNVATYLLEESQHWISRVGKVLRKTSLDELPQIFNILKGKMNIVGHWSALWNQYNLNEDREKKNTNIMLPLFNRCTQINGSNEIVINVAKRGNL